MSDDKPKKEFLPLNIAILTVSDSRTEQDDKSGATLKTRALEAGHKVVDKVIVPDNIYKIREVVSRWIASDIVHVVISTGGTGLTGRDVTPEAVLPLFDKSIEGFGELFRQVSFEEIGVSTMQSRAVAGTANSKFIFCLPGSSSACVTGWDRLLKTQLDITQKGCNFAKLVPRLGEK